MDKKQWVLVSLMLIIPTAWSGGMTSRGAILTQHSVSLAMALTMAHAARVKCKADGFDVSVVVVDRAGVPILLMRSDTANPHNAGLARRKAYTALTFRQSSRDWARAVAATRAIAAQRDLKEVIALSGGEPLMWGKEPIGAIGVSGATVLNEDDRCAQAGVKSVLQILEPGARAEQSSHKR